MSSAAEEIDLYEQDRRDQEDLENLARTDILAFTKFTFPDYEIGWHHRLLAQKLNDWVEGKIKYLMVFMPPRHGKSELVSRRLPAYLHGRYPNSEIMAASYLDSLACDMTIAVQSIIDSREYRAIFPETRIPKPRTIYTEGTRNASEHTTMNALGEPYPKGRYRGQGVGGSFTGKGANWIIVDDPIKGREIADSEAFRERLWNFWSNDLYSRLETDLKSGRQGQVLITQTRWHEDDLSGRLIEQMKKNPEAMQFEILHLPAIRVDKDNKEDTREIGEALWPKKYNVKQLTEIKAGTTPRGWSAVYQQDPVPGDGNLFKDGMFEFVDIPPMEYFDYIFTTADTAYKEKEENDFTVFSVWGVIDDQIYLIDVYYKQIASSEIERDAEPWLTKFIRYGYRQTWIEPKGHGIYLNQVWMRKGLNIPSEQDIVEFYKDRRHDKVERANNVVPHLAHRKVLINKAIANGKDLVAQCLGFPKIKHDDFVDTLIDALKKVYGIAMSILDVLGGQTK